MSHDQPSGEPTGPPEYLEQGAGAPLPPTPAASGGAGKVVLIGGAAVGGLALVGAGAWAALLLMGGGAQPSEALPASTLAYASVDLDPSAGQKIEALKMLNSFPAFEDKVGLGAQDDLRRELFNWVQKDAECAHLDYADDIEPWLGDRAALAAVDLGEKSPGVAFVVQSKDDGAADAGLAMIRNCSATGDADDATGVDDSDGGWVVRDGWVVLSTDEKTAAQIADAADEGTLADDSTYQSWLGEIGDPGIMTMYAAPAAGQALADLAGDLGGMGMLGGGLMPASYGGDGAASSLAGLKDFRGAAATLRFNDGSLELELAAGTNAETTRLLRDGGADVVMTLPEDTAAAVSMGLAQGWLEQLLENLDSAAGDGSSVADLLGQLESETGLSLPQDVETLTGDSMALALGSGIDLDALSNSSDPAALPLAMKVHGDPAAIQDVLDTLRRQMGSDLGLLETDASGEDIVIGPNADYRAAVLEDGGLGDSDTFRGVIREADRASMVLYVDFDAGDNWLVSLAGSDRRLAANLEPLAAFGVSTWSEGDAVHVSLRLTTD